MGFRKLFFFYPLYQCAYLLMWAAACNHPYRNKRSYDVITPAVTPFNVFRRKFFESSPHQSLNFILITAAYLDLQGFVVVVML